MNPAIKQYANLLNGVEYGEEDTLINPIAADLKEQRIVIVFVVADDIVVFSGAINEEIDTYGKTTIVYLKNDNGLLLKAPCGYNVDPGDCPYYKVQEREAPKIKALWRYWRGGGDYSWTFETDIPHETFDVIKDGKKYCRGIVFCLDELEKPLMFGSEMTFKDAAKRGMTMHLLSSQ